MSNKTTKQAEREVNRRTRGSVARLYYDLRMNKVEEAYTRLSFLHTETMAELVETRKRMDQMSGDWWWLLKHRIALKLGMIRRHDDNDF